MAEKFIKQLAILENRQIRRRWDEKGRGWLFVVADFIGVVSGIANPSGYWESLKEHKRKESGINFSRWTKKIKIQGPAGVYLADAATIKNLFRIIQAVDLPQVEPIKRWLAETAEEKIEDVRNPDRLIRQAMDYYIKKGYSADWVNLRLRSIATRKALTSEWRRRGVTESDQFSALTNEITRAWSGMDTKKYKILKRVINGNLRNHMSSLELILNMLAETSAAEISRVKQPRDFDEIRRVTLEGGRVAGTARRKLEKHLARSVITHRKQLRKSG